MCALISNLLNTPTEPNPVEFRDPIFLIGLMRSGTTLLMNILSEHPQLLKVGFELNDIWSKIGGASCSFECVERHEGHLKPEYSNNMTSYFTKYLEDSKGIKRHLARWSAKRHYGSGGIFYDWDNIYLMNKSPHLSNKIRYLHAMFPKAKFIVIVRSLEAQVASMKMHFLQHHKDSKLTFYLPPDGKSCWTNIEGVVDSEYSKERLFPGNFNLLAEAWLRLNKMIMENLQSIPKEQKIVFSYENLMNDRANILEELFSFLNLENKHRKHVKKIIAKERKIHNTTTKGNPLEKWKKYLEADEIAFLNKFKEDNSNEIGEISKKCN